MEVDLRSDTVSLPTVAMLEAMRAAKVGDDVYREDPSVSELEAYVAELLGKEAAIFVPSGTMANTIALLVHCQPGDAIIVEKGAHCLEFEAGAAAAFGGLVFRNVHLMGDSVHDALASEFRPDDLHQAPTKLLVIENTHNFAGGLARSEDQVAGICSVASSMGLPVHCDGARLWNAAVYFGCPPSRLVQQCASVSVCFSKGLGAPVGSALVGPAVFIDKARKVRKRLGGGMRQAGFLAAAALYGLQNHRDRLVDDHTHAKQLASRLIDEAGFACEVNFGPNATNMVYFRSRNLSGEVVKQRLRERGVLLNTLGKDWLRAVFHLGVSSDQTNFAIEQCLEVARLQ